MSHFNIKFATDPFSPRPARLRLIIKRKRRPCFTCDSARYCFWDRHESHDYTAQWQLAARDGRFRDYVAESGGGFQAQREAQLLHSLQVNFFFFFF